MNDRHDVYLIVISTVIFNNGLFTRYDRDLVLFSMIGEHAVGIIIGLYKWL